MLAILPDLYVVGALIQVAKNKEQDYMLMVYSITNRNKTRAVVVKLAIPIYTLVLLVSLNSNFAKFAEY